MNMPGRERLRISDKKQMTFLGLQSEGGQSHAGLKLSSQYAIEYLSCYFKIQSAQHLAGHAPAKSVWQDQRHWTFFNAAYELIVKQLRESSFHVNWGGDHSLGVATAAAFRAVYPEGFVLWIDAHADLNIPEASPSGNLHGMPLSFLLGLVETPNKDHKHFYDVLPSDRLIYLGVRDLDPFELRMVRELGIRCYTMSMIRSRGLKHVMAELARTIGASPLHVSFDIDSVDPDFAPSTGVPSDSGLTPDDLFQVASCLSRHCNIRSADVMEINPMIGSSDQVLQTYSLAVQFLDGLKPAAKQVIKSFINDAFA